MLWLTLLAPDADAAPNEPLTLLWSAAPADQVIAYFGDQIASADVNGDGFDDVIVSAWQGSVDDAYDGFVNVYLGSPTGTVDDPSWTADGDSDFAGFGSSLAAGDLNGDGFGDVVVGQPPPDALAGPAELYLGSASGLATVPIWTAEPLEDVVYPSVLVACAGDVDNDGYDDVIVSSPGYRTATGKVSLYRGSPTGPEAEASWSVEGDMEYQWVGWAAAAAGDVNGDTYDDVVISTSVYGGTAGQVMVYAGGPVGLGEAPLWSVSDPYTDDTFGASVASAGDVNGDGYDDVIVGAPCHADPEPCEGEALVYHGSAGGPGGAPAWTAESDQELAGLGWAVASAGDVNSDGYDDVLVSAWKYDDGQNNEGRVWLYFGSAAGLEARSFKLDGNQAGAWYGSALASAGDVNDDGYGDVIIGAAGFRHPEDGEGRADVYAGGPFELEDTDEPTDTDVEDTDAPTDTGVEDTDLPADTDDDPDPVVTDDEGCGCTASGAAGLPGWWLALAAVTLRRRYRSAAA
jgi:MYXO-CTERM domain-containing protein